jgi:hypothetical protein
MIKAAPAWPHPSGFDQARLVGELMAASGTRDVADAFLPGGGRVA